MVYRVATCGIHLFGRAARERGEAQGLGASHPLTSLEPAVTVATSVLGSTNSRHSRDVSRIGWYFPSPHPACSLAPPGADPCKCLCICLFAK
jgi:hypothetical protein